MGDPSRKHPSSSMFLGQSPQSRAFVQRAEGANATQHVPNMLSDRSLLNRFCISWLKANQRKEPKRGPLKGDSSNHVFLGGSMLTHVNLWKCRFAEYGATGVTAEVTVMHRLAWLIHLQVGATCHWGCPSTALAFSWVVGPGSNKLSLLCLLWLILRRECACLVYIYVYIYIYTHVYVHGAGLCFFFFPQETSL